MTSWTRFEDNIKFFYIMAVWPYIRILFMRQNGKWKVFIQQISKEQAVFAIPIVISKVFDNIFEGVKMYFYARDKILLFIA